MFTGTITEIATVRALSADSVTIERTRPKAVLAEGGSMCVNGVQLTVRGLHGPLCTATLSEETRRRSTFDTLTAGRRVHLEAPLSLGDPLDGHLVQGSVGAVGKVLRREDEGGCVRLWFRPPERVLPRLLAKSPISVDGVSVTVAEVLKDRFSVVLLPVTLESTTLGELGTGDRVNLELDLISRLVARESGGAGAAVTAAIGRLPWAGRVTGRTGVDKVVRQFAAGGGVVVWDPATEGEGDVVFAATGLKPESFAFLVSEVRGMPAVPCAGDLLDRLDIAAIPGDGDRHGTAFCVPVDLAASPGTGVSAAERAATIRRLACPEARPEDFLRPGHVSPLRARPGLLAERPGHTEATVALCRAAGLPEAGVCCEIMSRDGVMAGGAEVETAALAWGLPLVDIADLRTWLDR